MRLFGKKKTGTVLMGEELRKIVLSALYAKQQMASVNTFETGLSTAKREKKIHEILPEWDKIMLELIDQKIIRNVPEMDRLTAIGWDVGRIIFVARLSAESGYIDHETAIAASDSVSDAVYSADNFVNG